MGSFGAGEEKLGVPTFGPLYTRNRSTLSKSEIFLDVIGKQPPKLGKSILSKIGRLLTDHYSLLLIIGK